MQELSREGRELLNALVAAPRAWQSPAELARRLSRGIDETTDLLCELDLGGWLALWEGESGIKVTLSPKAAETLRARLTVAEERRAPIEMPHARRNSAARSGRSSDRREASDEGIGRSAPSRDTEGPAPLPAASSLRAAGIDPRPGPRPGDDPRVACPQCGSERMGPQLYCIYCDRWDAKQTEEVAAHSGRTSEGPNLHRPRSRRRSPFRHHRRPAYAGPTSSPHPPMDRHDPASSGNLGWGPTATLSPATTQQTPSL